MYDMIFRNDIGIVLILISPEEGPPNKNKWLPYFPTDEKALITDNYSIQKFNLTEYLGRNFFHIDYTIRHRSQIKEFKVFHYENWPDRSRFI